VIAVGDFDAAELSDSLDDEQERGSRLLLPSKPAVCARSSEAPLAIEWTTRSRLTRGADPRPLSPAIAVVRARPANPHVGPSRRELRAGQDAHLSKEQRASRFRVACRPQLVFVRLRQRAAMAPAPPSMHTTVVAKASACARRRDVQAG
jgi:hypothetical protein